jgi:hypothetical protein
VAVHPHYLEFFRLARESARKEINYQALTAVPPLEFVKGLFFFDDTVSQANIYYSWPAVLLAVTGLILMVLKRYRLPQSDESGPRQSSCLHGGSTPPDPEKESAGLGPYGGELRQLALLLGLAPFSVIAFAGCSRPCRCTCPWSRQPTSPAYCGLLIYFWRFRSAWPWSRFGGGCRLSG